MSRFYKNILLNAIEEDGEGHPLVTESEKRAYINARFQAEFKWEIDRSGIHYAAKSWIQGLAINVPYMNYEILELGKAAGILRKNASELSCDDFIEGYWEKLGNKVAYWYSDRFNRELV